MSQEGNLPKSSSGGDSPPPVDPKSVQGAFIEAMSKESGAERSHFLDTACRGNAELRARVEALLRAYDDAGSFLQQPAADWRHPPLMSPDPMSAEADDRGIPIGLLRPSNSSDCLGTIGPYHARELIGRGGDGDRVAGVRS